MRCKFCDGLCAKNGFQKNRSQRYKCKVCQKRQQLDYSYNACNGGIDQQIVILTKEGVGIRSTARILKISTSTLQSKIISIAKSIRQPVISKGKIFQVDEMRTYIRQKSNLSWIVYALEQETKNVVSFNVGRRTNKTLKKVITSLELSDAKRIVTDKLKHYRYLIKKEIHSTKH